MDCAKPSLNVRIFISVLLLLVTFGLYFQVNRFDFINYDDEFLLVDNANVNSGISWENIAWSLTSTDKYHWIPLTWISHMADFLLFGTDASGHHLTNVVFHLLNTLVLLLFLYKATHRYWQSAFVAALFALHPLHVESVAWVTARKDVLSSLFWLITLLLYLRYVQRPGIMRYLLTLGTYILALMAKPMVITLPFLLLLLDYWPLQRIGFDSSAHSRPIPEEGRLQKLVYEKIPFIVVSAVFSLLVYFTQLNSGAISTLQDIPLTPRISNVIVAYAKYVWKMFWPAKLAVIYPYRISIPVWEVVISATFLIFVTLWVFRNAKSHRYLPVGWLWFLGTLLPVIGIIQIGYASMADKFTYIPLIGLFLMIAWGIPDLLGKWQVPWRRNALTISVTIVLLVLSMRTGEYLGCWKDNITLYTKALEVTDDNFMVLNNLGEALAKQGRIDEAIEFFSDSVRANPRFEIAYVNLGYAFMGKHDYYEAAYDFTQALEQKPNDEITRMALQMCLNEISRKTHPSKSGAPHG